MGENNEYMKRMLDLRCQLSDFSDRISDCAPEDAEFYCCIAQQYAAYLHKIQCDYLKSPA